ncbi:hypothetical protein ABB37_05033 [Leptomonas pyrrhocoris]|uniref:Thioredoxin domain-containing protein n=1 Tax=Leptomonas pyrrhocoris TaxID=157538 RepID=A0A0M9G0Y7_LEPPY|nr:hypothetical protein ABB37_05033 [Leptomonas pyrrhocoris]XP_015658442.1 hypothetical protein ABB37_05033 [Leptomonas pyrrhocoris]KPA80002.1 hypothetical protein ABB37_05033 [Leptomonas pyrrhocoris]KPA80003.1 hypothetical protein ABB37_05033 [Leptomonas pyrrhocoris]|eukprot:XP_015658441.1 hypothetical protein ABB37_05033 [Leptomonas pyrrhocoris]
MDSYQRHLSFSSNPVVLFLFDHDPQTVHNLWQPLVTRFSQAMEKFGINVADVDLTSEVGLELQQAIGSGAAILFFQGVGDTPVNGEKGLKVPLAYQGAVDLLSLAKWALSCVSPSVVLRVRNDADLARFLALFPRYPTLPHVLFFPLKNYTHAGFLTISQHFSHDAGFAVVPGAFVKDEATAIARRYGVTGVEELPALLVLHKASADEDDGAGDSDYAVRMNSTSSSTWSYAGVKAFLDGQLPDTIEALVAKAEATQDPKVLAVAEARRQYMAAALVERQQDVVEEERLALLVEPIVARDQAAWAEHCLQLPKGHKCLAAFVDSTQDPAAQRHAVQVLSSVSLKLMELLAMEARSVALVVVEREGSDAVREYFEAGRNGFPDLVLISLSRPARYYNFVGSFSAESIVQFVTSHDPRFAKEEVRGGHAFIPRMVPQLASPVVHDSEDDGDL